jgi:hypothetical protein
VVSFARGAWARGCIHAECFWVLAHNGYCF